MLSAFTDVLHVANLSTGAHLISILKQVRCHTLSHSHPMSLVYIAHTNPCFRVTPSPRRTSPSWPASSADARPASGSRSSWGSSIWSSKQTQGILVFLSCYGYTINQCGLSVNQIFARLRILADQNTKLI